MSEKQIPQIGDRVTATDGIGWGREHQTGIVTNREVFAGAEHLGELCEVTFKDGLQIWCGDNEIEVIPA